MRFSIKFQSLINLEFYCKATDGAASMTGKENGAVVLLKKYLQESDFTQDVIASFTKSFFVLRV